MKNYLVAVLICLSCAMSAVAQEGISVIKHNEKQYTLIFKVNETEIDLDHKGNGRTLDELISDLNALNGSTDTELDSLVVVASSSPEGSRTLNNRLSAQRSSSIKTMLLEQIPEVFHDKIRIENRWNDWSATIQKINDDDSIPYRDTILSVLNNTRITYKDAALRAMPAVWNSLRSTLLDKMRTAEIIVYTTQTEVVPPVPEPEPLPEPAPLPESELQPEQQPEPVQEAEPEQQEPVRILKKKMIFAPRMNLLVPGFNIGIEVPIKENWSVGADYYFPWILPKSNKWCVQMIAGFVDARYWFPGSRYQWNDTERLQGHAVGLYAGGGLYDVQHKRNGAQGEFFDVGVDYTFALPLADNRLRMEFNIGLGFLRTSYEPYYTSSDYKDLIKEPGIMYNSTNFFGPTRASVSLVVPIVVKTKASRADKTGGEK